MKTRVKLLLALLVLAGLASIPWGRIFEPKFEPEWGGQFEGMVPGLGAVRARLASQEPPQMLLLETVIPNKTNQLWLAGTNDGRGISFRSEGDDIPMRIETSSTAENLNGTVQLTNRPQASFELRRIAGWLGYRRTSGLAIRQRGTSFSWHGAIPELNDGDFSRAITGWLKADVKEREAGDRQELTLEWRDRWDAWYFGGIAYQWDADLTWQLLHYRTNKASLRCVHYLYSGGAHGNTDIATANFRWENGSLHKIRLGEYFRPGADWQTALARELVADLKRQSASWPTEEAVIGAVRRETFNESEYGLIFYFSPYEVGSYAEGEYASLIRWEKLLPYLAEERKEWRQNHAEAEGPKSKIDD